ncbi:MAG: right-handed parallel beta-helix repeat-containing protein, partial [Bacteroidota bacterium]
MANKISFSLIVFMIWFIPGISGISAQGQCTGEVLNISSPGFSQTSTTGNWTVPSGGPYKVKITVKGAKGGDAISDPTGGKGGKGRVMEGEFFVSSGEVLDANAGSPGLSDNAGAGGGGGSAVKIGSTLLILGGGGGGGGGGSPALSGLDANSTQEGSAGNPGGAGGNSGDGGSVGPGALGGAGGGGFFAPGGDGGYSGGGGAGFNGAGGWNGGGGGTAGGGRGINAGATGLDPSGGGGGGGYSGGGGGVTGNVMTFSDGGGGGGGGSYNIGAGQNNSLTNNVGGQVIIECLGTATLSATVTVTQPVCASPTQGSVSINLTGDLNGNTSGLEYAIVSGSSFSGSPTFADITADPFNLTGGFGTTSGTYTVRIRGKYNPGIYLDNSYSIITASSGTIYVNHLATGANNGTTWTDAFTDLQSALANPCPGSQIWVAAGTYQPPLNASFSMRPGVAILGGFPNTGNPDLNQRNWSANPTILLGNGGVVIFNYDNGLTHSSVLDGFTVKGGTEYNGIGGGAYNFMVSPAYLNCIFTDNAANLSGTMYIYFGSTVVTNCLFTGNSVNNSTGTLFIMGTGSTTPIITNCTFSGNNKSGIFCGDLSQPIITNCIVWGNENGIYTQTYASPTISHCIVQGGFSGTGNLNVDPLFVSQPAIGLGATGDLHLQPCSPAIDNGTNAGAPAKDLDGNARPFSPYGSGTPTTDMGAYEYSSPVNYCTTCLSSGILYVNAAATGMNNGISWANAYTDLQSALSNPCTSITQIWVAAGTYKPTSGADRNISFVMKNGMAIYGGFNGTETLLSQRNRSTNVTILSGDIGTPTNSSDNSYHVIKNNNNGLDNTAILDGFTITGGTDTRSFPDGFGGGMYNNHSSPSIVNCIFSGNAATYGGGIFNESSQITVINCIFSGNTSGNSGAGIQNNGSNSTVMNCTFYGNTAPSGASLFNLGANPLVTNTIIWGNSSGVSNNSSSPVITYSIVEGGYAGTGNISADPHFMDVANTNLHLQACSPAINAGTNTGAPSNDLDGNLRPFNPFGVGTPMADMGAFEYSMPITDTILYVNQTAIGSNNGSSWANAFTDLQSALNSTCHSKTQIWVAAGIYKPTSGTDRGISFAMKNGVALYGGFNGTETSLTERNWKTNVTILSGDIGTPNDNGDNSYHVFNNSGLNNTAILDGFTISDGRAYGGNPNQDGGGMYNYASSPKVNNCIFLNNSVRYTGAGMFNNWYSSPKLVNCSFI